MNEDEANICSNRDQNSGKYTMKHPKNKAQHATTRPYVTTRIGMFIVWKWSCQNSVLVWWKKWQNTCSWFIVACCALVLVWHVMSLDLDDLWGVEVIWGNSKEPDNFRVFWYFLLFFYIPGNFVVSHVWANQRSSFLGVTCWVEMGFIVSGVSCANFDHVVVLCGLYFVMRMMF